MLAKPPIDLDVYRMNFIGYIQRIYHLLPNMEHPRILDIGCGTGIPTIELARLTNGDVTGIDIDKQALDRCNAKINNAHLSDRVRTMQCSLLDMEFPDGYFDIIWAEGSVFVLGFKKSLEKWRRLLKSGGFLVVHDAVGNLRKKLEIIPCLGYTLIDHILISGDEWWEKYFKPLQEEINEVRAEFQEDKKARVFLDKRQKEIDDFNNNRAANGSVYIVVQKCDQS